MSSEKRQNDEIASPLLSDSAAKTEVAGDRNIGRQESYRSMNVNKQKKLTVFDEYEQRGGILEGYEDLNA